MGIFYGASDPEKHRTLSSKGGRSAHAKGNAHEWDSEQARAAGRLGGKRAAENRKKRAESVQGEAANDAE
jgi:general stress protein YciG